MVECWSYEPKVAGSIPAWSKFLFCFPDFFPSRASPPKGLSTKNFLRAGDPYRVPRRGLSLISDFSLRTLHFCPFFCWISLNSHFQTKSYSATPTVLTKDEEKFPHFFLESFSFSSYRKNILGQKRASKASRAKGASAGLFVVFPRSLVG